MLVHLLVLWHLHFGTEVKASLTEGHWLWKSLPLLVIWAFCFCSSQYQFSIYQTDLTYGFIFSYLFGVPLSRSTVSTFAWHKAVSYVLVERFCWNHKIERERFNGKMQCRIKTHTKKKNRSRWKNTESK